MPIWLDCVVSLSSWRELITPAKAGTLTSVLRLRAVYGDVCWILNFIGLSSWKDSFRFEIMGDACFAKLEKPSSLEPPFIRTLDSILRGDGLLLGDPLMTESLSDAC